MQEIYGSTYISVVAYAHNETKYRHSTIKSLFLKNIFQQFTAIK